MAKIIINNKTLTGKNINLTKDKIIIDGLDVTPNSTSLNIEIKGNLDSLTVAFLI